MPLQLPPLSLYIHIPWCVRKCPYCDFNSHAVRDALPEQEYIECLLADLRDETRFVQGRQIQSIFFGGGTPSLFSADSYQRLLQDIDSITPLADGIEITLEANPGTFEQDKFRGFRAAGINRLSLGIQSFSNPQLQALGRIHDADEALHAATLAREIFPRLNLDLMHGLPDQTCTAALADLEQALSVKPDHLSWYQLTIEPNTEFHARPPQLPVDETLWQIQEEGQQRLAAAGLQQYEISAYCQSEQEARHNLNYWQFGDYIGIGAGAHGKLTLPEQATILRRWKQKQPKAYMQAESRLGGETIISQNELAFEFMLNALRLTQGVDSELLQAYTGLTLEQLSPQLNEARRRGLLIDNPHQLAPTQQGRLFLNDLLGIFLD
ncbi:radical SAM family heme chaperone HemW [Pontibacter sp. JAM-7]|uniref:radical SAM family heme chaperone HemW n=1 Tax=Pontibacter sp. JAM-7 TaxID=3366581 RepID=UPI003AF64AC4